MDFVYKRSSSYQELHEILDIQKRNVKSILTDEELRSEGFITVNHNFEMLKKMNDTCPHIIVKDGNTVAGYALVMLPSFKQEIPTLIPMFNIADELLGDKNYLAMGQICIDKPYRKLGLFRGMYQYYRKELQNKFDCLITEVASDNIRSLEAHKRIGFKILLTQIRSDTSWVLMKWGWK